MQTTEINQPTVQTMSMTSKATRVASMLAVSALALGLAPGIALTFQVLEHHVKLMGELFLFLKLVLAHTNNIGDMLNAHRAHFHTGTAGSA